jgi:hypothetical protein
MYLLKKNLFRYIIFLKNWGSGFATIMDEAPVERGEFLSVSRLTASEKLGQNQAKVFLSELYCASLVIKIVHYRQYMYQRVWNVTVLIGKTQVLGMYLGQVRPGPPHFLSWISWLSKFRGLEEHTWSSARIFHTHIWKFVFKRLLIYRSAGHTATLQIYYLLPDLLTPK